MQIKSVRGALVTLAAGAAIAGAPVVAQAAPLPLEPATPQEDAGSQHAGPVLAVWDPQTGSSSLSSNVNARFLCVFQTASAQGGLDCLNGQK